MMRRPNSNTRGWNFTEDEKQAVWEKAVPVRGYDPKVYRRDKWGAWIKYSDWGIRTGGDHGWEIDHILPVCLGGTDALENLQPLHWRNNRCKGDAYPEPAEGAFLTAY